VRRPECGGLRLLPTIDTMEGYDEN
jgi:hypothetical protein